MNQLVFSQILSETDYSFQIVGNGRLALEAFGELNPRMILMDVSMPEMNGLEATGAIRNAEAGTDRHVPIIGVTAHALKGDRERCLEAGMDDYLPKPISPRALIEKIGALGLAVRQAGRGRRLGIIAPERPCVPCAKISEFGVSLAETSRNCNSACGFSVRAYRVRRAACRFRPSV